MSKKFKKGIITIILFIYFTFIALSNMVFAGSWISSKYNIAGNQGAVTDYDFAKLAETSEFITNEEIAKLVGDYMNLNWLEGEETIDEANALCIGHLNSNMNSGDSYYKISTIIDITPSKITSWKNDDKKSTISAQSNQKHVKAIVALTELLKNTANVRENADVKGLLKAYNEELKKLGINNPLGKDINAKEGDSNFVKPYYITGEKETSYVKKVINHKFVQVPTKPKRQTQNGYDYYGPFKIEKSSDIDSISISVTGGGTYKGISETVGGTIKSSNNIASNTNFYVVTTSSTSTQERKIKLTATTNDTFYKARLMFLKNYAMTSGGQNLLIFRVETDKMPDDVLTLNVDGELETGRLRIIKSDEMHADLKLKGAKFIIQRVSDDRYIKDNSNIEESDGTYNIKQVNYTGTKHEAYEFVTPGEEAKDLEGCIDIKNLPVGTYKIIEKEAPENYEISTESSTITIVKNKKTNIENLYEKALTEIIESFIQVKKDKGETYKAKDVWYALTGQTTSQSGATVTSSNALSIIKDYKSVAKENKTKEKINGANQTGYTDIFTHLEERVERLNSSDKVFIQEYLARVYGRLANKDENRYTIKNSYVIKLYSRILGIDVVSLKNKTYGRLRVLKSDDINYTKRLNGAKFKIKYKANGQYISKNSNITKGNYATTSEMKGSYFINDVVYTSNENEAMVFETYNIKEGTTVYEGYLDIEHIYAGNYTLIEVSAPDGYTIKENQKEITVQSSEGEKNEEWFKERALASLIMSGSKYKNGTLICGDIYYIMTGNTSDTEYSKTKVQTKEELLYQIDHYYDSKYLKNEGITYERLNYNLGNLSGSAEFEIQQYLARAYGRMMHENPEYYMHTKELRNTYVLTLYSRVIGVSATEIRNNPIVGNLKIVKVDKDDNSIKLPNVEFKIKNKDKNKYVRKLSTNMVDYVGKTEATIFKTDSKGEILIKNLLIGDYVIEEVKNPNTKYEIITEGIETEVTKDTTKELKIENEKMKLGEFTIDKHDSRDTSKKLSNVKFTIRMTSGKYAGTYVNIDKDGKAKYQEEKCELVTDKNGKITIKDMYLGTYRIIETENNNYGYTLEDDKYDQYKTLTKEMQKEDKYTLSVPNVQKYIKLSGYVWVDKHDEFKQTKRNDLYDKGEETPQGIIVRLKGTTIKGNLAKTTTDENGKYIFEKVPIEDLESCYIEFEYDGYMYTNVEPHIDKNNGSKALEVSLEREEFNNHFTTIVGNTENSGRTLNESGEKDYYLSYTTENHKSTFKNEGNLLINAYTNNTGNPGYRVIDHYKDGQEEIKNINLGLYRRAEPDIAIMNDLENVRVSINNNSHIYNYNSRFKNEGTPEVDENGKDAFDIGVKFGDKYGSTPPYTRPIYKSDYSYANSEDTSSELEVYLTYKIAIRNESTSLKAEVNLTDYYDNYDENDDKDYNLVKVGTTLNDDGTITGDVEFTDSYYNDEYRKVTISPNIRIEPLKQMDIYVQFRLNRKAVEEVINNGENLNNIVEIKSYSIFDKNGNTYAGIDKDSNPGNIVIGDMNTYEDDTDSAPGIQLVKSIHEDGEDKKRTITGKVFVDTTSKELKIGEIRQGDGEYNNWEEETGVEGVKVELIKNPPFKNPFIVETNEKGEFKFDKNVVTNEKGDVVEDAIIPGDYILKYTWGNETYVYQNVRHRIKVQDYKGTVFKDKDRAKYYQTWYKAEYPRYSDALDNYELRQQIDNEIKNVTYKTNPTIQKMESNTPMMEIGVEYENTPTDGTKEERIYEIKNVDFGITERARQSIEVKKRVKTIKATLANGQVIVDATIDENGNITGQKNYLTNVGPLKLEIDKELIQGTTLEVGYEIKVINNSELDYMSEEFYKYGEITGEKVKFTKIAILDYLDKDWGFDAQKNIEWQIKTLDNIKDMDIVGEKVHNSTSIKDKYILYSEKLSEIEPGKSETLEMKVSKILSASDEIELKNETEVVKVDKTGGSKLIQTPGNYVPGDVDTYEDDTSEAKTVSVITNTGDNRYYLPYVLLGISSLIIVGLGIIFIKKKII